jgi:uncharacterized integral membrane protein (TIGR00698 family)
VALPFTQDRAWRAAVPGAALAIALALTAHFGSKALKASIAHGSASAISPVLLGIVLGMLWRHFIGLGPQAARGVEWILTTLLRAGIALVGLRLTLDGLASAGPRALLVVAACITTAWLVATVVGRMLGLSTPLRQLLAVGSAVCGCTAIMATAPAIRARPLETGTALTCVVLIGSLGMVLYPWIAAALFPGANVPVGVFLGSAIHDTSQVVGASLIYAQQFSAPDVVAIASATKLFRNLSIVALIPLMAWLGRADERAALDEGVEIRRSQVVPAFVIWFMVFVVIRALGDHFVPGTGPIHDGWLQAVSASQTLSEILLICGMTAVGLNISLVQMYSTGARAIVTALVVAAATAACSLSLTYLLFRALA